MSKAAAARMPSVHQSQTQPLGISTGGLMSRRSLVPCEASTETALVVLVMVPLLILLVLFLVIGRPTRKIEDEEDAYGSFETLYPCSLLRSRVSKNRASSME